MNFKIFHIFVVSLYARNLTSVWTPEMHSQRKADLSTRNGTDDFIDGLSEYEKWMYSNFVSSSKLYPDKLDLLLEPGLKNFKQAVSGIPIRCDTNTVWMIPEQHINFRVQLKTIFTDRRYKKHIPGFIGEDQSEVNLDLDLLWIDSMNPSDSMFSGSFIFNINWRDDRLKWDLSQGGS